MSTFFFKSSRSSVASIGQQYILSHTHTHTHTHTQLRALHSLIYQVCPVLGSWIYLPIHPSIFYNEFRQFFSPPLLFVTTSLTHLNDL